MSKLKQKYPISKKKHKASRDDDSDNDMEDPTDGDVIRCVCDDSDDDGFTIQCEHCENWQHASCVNIKKSNIPEHYMCDRCSRKLAKRDPHQARRRHSSSEADKRPRSKKRAIPQKRTYPLDSDDDDHDDDDDDNHDNNDHDSTTHRTKFTPLSKNVFKEKLVQHLLVEVHRQWMESNKSGNKHKAELATNSSSSSSSSSAAVAKGLESIVVMESNLLLPAIPKASVKPLRRSLRGTFLQQQQQADPSVEKGVFADIHIPEQRYLMEVTGEYARKSECKNDPANHFTLLGTPPAHVFFFRNIDICIDARYAGNDTRYIRRSCAPNAEIRGVILPNDSDDHTIHMGVYTTEPVDRGEEITLAWHWQRGYLMWNKHKEFLRHDHRHVAVLPSEVDALKHTLQLIAAEFGDCACEDKDACLIQCLKDELEKQDDNDDNDDDATAAATAAATATAAAAAEHDAPSASKRKKLAKPSKRAPTVIASDIFSSDQEEPKEEHKQVKRIKQGSSKRHPVHAPASPTVSQTDSVDIDIISMSPLPSQPASESESETLQLPGYKRPRPLEPGDIRLPIKKRWLQRYLDEQRAKQQQQQQQQHSEAPLDPAPTDNTTTHDDTSDGASSDSTLPLQDTPKTQQGHADQQPPDDSTSTVPDTTTTLPPQEQDGSTHSAEPSSSSTSMDQVKQAKKKLSLQEYLLMRRGNLPTPDEKHASTE
ncbi:hypothetical protein MBANPS3_007040 [Mucor bainieri]